MRARVIGSLVLVAAVGAPGAQVQGLLNDTVRGGVRVTLVYEADSDVVAQGT
jgi:hypothetical protein